MPENFQINQEDPIYRKKIFDFLKSNFSDFNKSEKEFYDKLDADNTYSSKVYDVISNNFSDFGRKREDFISLMSPVKKKELGGIGSLVGGQVGGLETPSITSEEPKPSVSVMGSQIGTIPVKPIQEMPMSEILKKYSPIENQDIEITQEFADDPLKHINESLLTRKSNLAKEYLRKVVNSKQLYPENSTKFLRQADDLDNTLEYIKESAFPTVESAKNWLNRNPNTSENQTSKLAKDVIDDYNNAESSFFRQDWKGNLVSQPVHDAAIKYYSQKDNPIGEKLRKIIESGKQVPEDFAQDLVNNFLQEKSIIEISKKNPAIGLKIQDESINFFERNPNLANNFILHKISQARDKYGENNWFLNVTGVKSSDKMIDLMVEKGELSPRFKKLYERYTRPLIESGWGQIDTPGLVESLTSGVGKGLGDVAKSVYTGLPYVSAKSFRESFLPKGEKEVRELQAMASKTPETKYKGLHWWSNLTGNLLSYAIPIGGGGKLINGVLKLGKGSMIGSQVMTGLVFYNDIYENELKSGKSPEMARLSALIQSAIWSKGADVFKGLTKGMVREASPEINKVLESLQSGAITNKEAAQNIIERFGGFLARTGKESIKDASHIAKLQMLNTTVSNVLSGKFDFDEVALSGAKTFGDMTMGLLLPSMIKSIPKARQTVTDFHNAILADKDLYRSEIKDPELIKNFDRLVRINEEVQGYESLSPEQKEALRLSQLQQEILKEKADNTSIEELKKKDNEEIERLAKEKENIVNGKLPEEVKEETGAEQPQKEVIAPAKEEQPVPKPTKEAEKPQVLQKVKSPKEIAEGDTVSWKGNQMVVESVNNKGGFDLRGKEDKFYTVKDARITDEEFGGKFVGGEVKPEKFGVGFAPFREKNVFTVEQDNDIRNSPDYKLHQENVEKISEGLGINVNKKLDTWGGYIDSETKRPVQEVSNIMEIEATPEQARLMAAILGKAAPEMQDSVLLGNYSENGTGLEHIVKTGSFDNANEAIKFLKDNDLQYFSVDKKTGDIIILDFGAKDSPKIINLVKQLNENGIPAKHEYGKINAEFVTSGDYDRIIEAERGNVKSKTGFDIDAFVKEAAGKYESLKRAGEEVEAEVPSLAEIKPEIKKISDSIRSLKIDISKLGEGGAQSNIIGIPVALYNTVVEAVATAVDAGIAVNKAINDAVKKYKLDKINDFDKNSLAREILKGIQITEPESNPVYFENLKKFASESSFENKVQFKEAIQDLLNKHLDELKKKFGKDFDPSVYDERTRKYLTDLVTKESLNAIKEHPEAIGWYDEKTQAALDVISAIHPEIATDAEARGAFILPLAVMSNGNKVDFNFELAEKQYQYFKENGRFNPDGEFGLQQSGIKKSLMLINSLLDNGLTMSDINKFLTSKYKASDLKVKIDGKIKDLASGELADEPVYGAVILGPKIGNGFYMNLWGQFDQLTMDRWFMRTWGRMTKTLIEKDASAILEGKKRLSNALKDIKTDAEATSILKSLMPKISSLSMEDLAKSVEKISMDKEKRSKLSSNPKTDELRKAANSLSKNISGEKEAPSTGKERKFIREVFSDVINELKTKHGIDISMADLQAALWYPEKILYESFKGGKTFEGAAEGYTSESAPDYLNSAKKLATKNGVNEERINQALSRGRERTERISGEGHPRSGQAVSESYKDILGRVKEAIGGKEEKVKDVPKAAQTVRSLKIKQEGLQSNILGIPIALYNAALETIATSIEAGATITDAIRTAIQKHKLNKEKDFDIDTFVKRLEDTTDQKVEKIGGKYAIQEPITGEVPVQPEAGIGEEVEGRVEEEMPSSVGIGHSETQKIRERYSLPEYEREGGAKDLELEAEADRLIKEGYNIDNLIKKLESGTQPTGVENYILAKYIASLDALIENNADNPKLVEENIGKLKRALNASDKIGTLQSESFRTRKAIVVKDDSLASRFIDEMDILGVDDLTENQKENIIKEYELEKKAKEAYDKRIVELEEENNRLRAEAEIKKTSKTKSPKKDYSAERKQIVQNIKDKLKEARGKTQATIVPYANELFTIAPDVAKLVKNIVEDGTTKLADIVEKVYNELKDSIPEIKENDIVSLIAGDYNKKPTRNQLAKDLFELKQEAKLLQEYEKLESGIEPSSEKKKIQKNQKLAELREKIKEHDLTKLSDYKKNIRSQIEKVQKQLDSGDFKPEPPKKEIIKDAEAIRLKDELIKVKTERQVRILKEAYQNRALTERGKDWIIDKLNVPRSVMASLDYSAPFRQGIVSFAARPTLGFKAFPAMFKASFNQKYFDRVMYEMREHPNFDISQKSGLAVTDPKSPFLQAREEVFMNNTAEKIPLIGKMIKGSERAYVTFLNKLRFDSFNRIIDAYESQGKTFENSPELYKATAKLINAETGRGSLGALENSATVLNTTFFSPRLIASRFNLLTNWANPYWYKNTPKEVRVMYMKDMLKFIGAGLTIIALAKINGNDVEDDPRSSDFGKIRSGNTRWDIFGGFQQYVRLISQMATGQKKTTTTGDIQELDEKGAFGETRGDVAKRFLRGKLAPVPATLADFLTGRKVTGEEVTVKNEALGLVTPLIINDVKDALKDKGVSAIFSVGIPAVFGIGVQTFTDKEPEIPKKINFNGYTIDLTDKQYEWFKANAQEKIKQFVSIAEKSPNFNNLSEKEKYQLKSLARKEGIRYMEYKIAKNPEFKKDFIEKAKVKMSEQKAKEKEEIKLKRMIK